MNIITVNHYYAGTGDIPPSFQSFDVVMADEAIELEKESRGVGEGELRTE